MTTAAMNGADFTDLLVDLHAFLAQIEAAKPSDKALRDKLSETAAALEARLIAARASLARAQQSLSTTADDTRAKLAAWREAWGRGDSSRLKELRVSLSQQYEALRLQMRAARVVADTSVTRQEVRPRNYIRNVFHASNAVLAAGLYHYVLSREQALIILGSVFSFYATLEITRRFSTRWNDFLVDKVFGSISRPAERYRVNSATIYLMALTLITFFFSREAVITAILVLGFGDPIASIVGKRWGKRKLYLDRSYAGTGAFVGASFVVVAAYFALMSVTVPLGAGLTVAAVTAVAGAGTELVSQKIDDNFSIPVVSAGVAEALLRVL